MIDDIIAELEALGWTMTPTGPNISMARGFGCADYTHALDAAIRRAVDKRWKERGK